MVISKIITGRENIIQVTCNVFEFNYNGMNDKTSMVDAGRLSFIPLESFKPISVKDKMVSESNGNLFNDKSWGQVKSIVEKVQMNIFVHTRLTYIRLLLERNVIRNAFR